MNGKSRAAAPGAQKGVTSRLLPLVLILGGVALSGCDKCGHRISIDAPSIQHACGDQPDPH